jgi:lipopolysaccharide/colanic/teichoic acid biosynthesis glycosyltransferase
MPEKLQNIILASGYSKVNYILNSFLNMFLALVLLILGLPFFIIISLIIKIQDTGPVFYKGVRLGFNKKRFVMYKFRTLIPDADKIIGAELLTAQVSSTAELQTTFGKFLRETRLDELPQLYNILKGDMDFLGPRPERPEIYEKLCVNIKGYDKRFSVKPGLIGFSQLFTPHSSPKRIRTLIDNRFLYKKQHLLWELIIIFITIFVTVERILHVGIKLLWNNIIKSKIFGIYTEKRRLDRVETDDAAVYYGPEENKYENFPNKAVLVDINEEALLFYSEDKIDYRNFSLQLETFMRKCFRKKNKKKIALCSGEMYKRIKIDKDSFKYAYVIKYSPISPFNFYMVHQYFLQKSII